MDYVVFGIGFGATILVLGLLLRDFGPRLRFRRSRDGNDVLSAEELVGKVSWTRFCTALGSVLALAGAVFLLITLVAMILVVSDDTGLWIMATAYALLLVIIAYWTWAYFDRFGSYGILPERAEPEPAPAAPRRSERPDSTPAYAGPPVPPATDAPTDASEPVTGMEERESEEEVAASEPAGDEPIEDAPKPVEAAITDMTTEATDSRRLETPEERLAHAETPIDHGSAEGDLDLAASARRRPGTRTPKRADPLDTSDSSTGDPASADDRDRS